MNTQSQTPLPRARWPRRLLITLGAVALTAVVLQWAASPIAKHIVNQKLSSMPHYTGHFDSVHVSLWRGGLTGTGGLLLERGRGDDLPVMQAGYVELTLSWGDLLRGKIYAKLIIEDTELIFLKTQQFEDVEAAKEKGRQELADTGQWQDAMGAAFPVELSLVDLRNCKVRYIDRSHNPQVDVAIENFFLTATGLRNRPTEEPLPAHISAVGTITGGGDLRVVAHVAPLESRPHFDANLEVKNLSLPPFNDFMRAYADADVSRGFFEAYVEVTAREGHYEGYVKPFFKDLDFKNVSDQDKPLGKRVKEKVISVTASLLENRREEKVATRIPFKIDATGTEVGVWSTIGNLLRNGFIQALREGLEGQTPEN